MRQIAAEVGVQAGALYTYTPDKQTLLFSLMHDHMTELLAEWGQFVCETDPLARLMGFVRCHLDYHLPRREAVFISYMELRNLNEENFATIENLRKSYEDRLEEIVQTGMNPSPYSSTQDVPLIQAGLQVGQYSSTQDVPYTCNLIDG